MKSGSESIEFRKKILIIGDSLSLPRGEVRYEETWPFLLKERFLDKDIIVLSRRGMTSSFLTTEGQDDGDFPPGSDFLEFYRPSEVILQLGIVDCYPRHFRNGGIEQKIVSRMPRKLRDIYIKNIKQFRGLKSSLAYTNVVTFRKNFECYLDRAIKLGVEKVILLSIIIVSEEKMTKSKEIAIQIQRYNEVLKEVANKYPNSVVLDPFQGKKNEEFLLSDGYHISSAGHFCTYQELTSIL